MSGHRKPTHRRGPTRPTVTGDEWCREGGRLPVRATDNDESGTGAAISPSHTKCFFPAPGAGRCGCFGVPHAVRVRRDVCGPGSDQVGRDETPRQPLVILSISPLRGVGKARTTWVTPGTSDSAQLTLTSVVPLRE